MKEKLLFLLLLSLFSFTGFSQSLERSVLASDGATNTLGNITLDWTLGELATTTLVTEDGLLTQGFHQPVLSVTKLLNYENLEDFYAIQVMPNPVSSLLNINVEAEREEPLSVDLLDLNGKLLRQLKMEFPFQPIQFDMSNYPSGLYIVRVKTENDVPVGMFKVNKLD
ncbi:MAG: T9SS C-terminal target domain-containing protein [Bacteroidetes bacterium]|nr:MAG: T9SS C-terminal target domain-containing protein [Bacteroidota bacterium]